MTGLSARLGQQVRAALNDLMKSGPGHIDSLDGLRALAAGAVLLHHTYIAQGGWIGVPVFFVLSGYLITAILVREHEATGGVDVLRFMRRRLLRLAPALLVVLALFSTYNIARNASFDTPSIRVLPWVIGYLGNWKQVLDGPHSLGLWGHTWSLAVEQQFYLVWPFLLLAAMRFGRGGVACVAGALILAIAAFRIFYVDPNPTSDRATQYAVDMLMLGALLSVWMRDRIEVVRALARLWPLAAAWLLIFVFWPEPLGGTAPAARIVGTAASGVLISALLTKVGPSRILASTPMVVLGRLSYGIYLWHLPATLALNGHIHNHAALTVAVAVVALVGAMGSWVAIEHPLMSLRHGERRRRATATIASTLS